MTFDPDATWLLDDHEVHLMPEANPDGSQTGRDRSAVAQEYERKATAHRPARTAARTSKTTQTFSGAAAAARHGVHVLGDHGVLRKSCEAHVAAETSPRRLGLGGCRRAPIGLPTLGCRSSRRSSPTGTRSCGSGPRRGSSWSVSSSLRSYSCATALRSRPVCDRPDSPAASGALRDDRAATSRRDRRHSLR